MHEELATDEEDDYWAVRLAVRHDHVLSKTAKTWESLEYLPRADDWADYLLQAEAGVEAALNARFNLRLVLQDRYDSEPPAGIDENDLTVVASLVSKF